MSGTNQTTKGMMEMILKMPLGPRRTFMMNQMRTTKTPVELAVRPVESVPSESKQIVQNIRETPAPIWMSIWVPCWHPARLNQIMKGHWSNGGRIKKADREVVQAAFDSSRLPCATGPRVLSVHLVLAKGQRGGDSDARDKSVRDSLVHAGALLDDTRKFCIPEPTSYSRSERDVWGTLILLRDDL